MSEILSSENVQDRLSHSKHHRILKMQQLRRIFLSIDSEEIVRPPKLHTPALMENDPKYPHKYDLRTTPSFRQWYYSLHYFLYLKRRTSPIASEEKEDTIYSAYRVVLPVLSALSSYYWNNLCNNSNTVICLIAPAALGIMLYSFSDDTFSELSDLVPSKHSPNQSTTNIAWKIFSEESKRPRDNEARGDSRHYTIQNSDKEEMTSISVTRSDRSIRRLLQSEMNLPYSWKDLPYLFTSRLLQLIDASFSLNEMHDAFNCHLHQELVSAVTLIVDETMERRIYARICSNIKNRISDMANVMSPLNIMEELFGVEAESSYSCTVLPCFSSPHESDDLPWEIKRDALSSSCAANEGLSTGDERDLITPKRKRSNNRSTSASPQCNPGLLDSDCTTSALRQTKSCIAMVHYDSTVCTARETAVELKSCIVENIDAAAITLAEGTITKAEGRLKQASKCSVVNEGGH